MAYQKVGGTPRFYIDQLQYLKSIKVDLIKMYEDAGYPSWYPLDDENGTGYWRTIYTDPDVFTFDPTIQKYIKHDYGIEHDDTESQKKFMIWDIPTGFPKGFYHSQFNNMGLYTAYLNHDLGDRTSRFFTTYRHKDGDSQIEVNETEILNLGTELYSTHAFNGATIFSLNEDLPEEYQLIRVGLGYVPTYEGETTEFGIGSILWGAYYDMPTSPDLDLTMEIEYDGVNNIKTLSGHTITQANYQGSPWWYDKDGNKVEPWSVGESTGISKRNGRRIWSLKFSYMSDKNLFASNYGSNNYLETDTDYDSTDLDTDTDNNNVFYYNIDTDDSFSSQVLNKISHGEKFIFQADKTSSNPSDFAICVLDGDSFSMKRTAFNVYDIEMTIREVW